MSKRDRAKSAVAYARHRAILERTSRLIDSRIGKQPRRGRLCVHEFDDELGNPINKGTTGHGLCPFATTCLLLSPGAEVLCEVTDAEASIDTLGKPNDTWQNKLGPKIRDVIDDFGEREDWGKLAKKRDKRLA